MHFLFSLLPKFQRRREAWFNQVRSLSAETFVFTNILPLISEVKAFAYENSSSDSVNLLGYNQALHNTRTQAVSLSRYSEGDSDRTCSLAL